jgi:hypothetical protein
MRFTLIHPSRSRPEKSRATINSWFIRATCEAIDNNEIELLVSLDSDDPRILDYYDEYPSHVIIEGDNKSSIEAINKAAAKSTGDILIVVSDDSSCPDRWDEIILNAIEGKSDFLLRVSDGIQKRTCTLPIMDRAYYNRFGYIYNPIYSHSWADTELTDVAYQLGRIIVRNDIVFPHLHPEVTKEPKDDLYKRNDLTHDRDRPLYMQRKKINFGL